MVTGLLAVLEQLDPSQPWRLTLKRIPPAGRVWRLYLDRETSPRLVIREP